MKYNMTGVIPTRTIVEAENPADAVEGFKKIFPGLFIGSITVNGKDLVGVCQECRRAIVDGEPYTPRRNKLICTRCLPR